MIGIDRVMAEHKKRMDEDRRIDDYLFSNEWVTLGDHRVKISVRDGCPGEWEREVAEVLTAALDRVFPRARLIGIFNDDTHCCISAHVAIDEPDPGRRVEALLTSVYWDKFGDSTFVADVKRVPASKYQGSDHYNHMDYLRRAYLQD